MKHMVMDVESVGLYGDGFAVGWVVVDDQTGRTLDSGRLATSSWQAHAHHDDDRRWVARNVPPLATNCETLVDVRTGFWQAWTRWRAEGALLWADCGYPVETAFLEMCVENFPGRRQATAPYPLHEIATLRMAVGLDPTGTEERLEGELPIHDPLADARQSARLLLEALRLNADMLARATVPA
jgi:hypothetical protein